MRRDEMPEDNADLARLQLDFPRLQPDTVETCPIPLSEIVEYLRMESSDAEAVNESQVRFLRTALVGDHMYWIWSFRESDGADCFVTVSASPDGATCTGYEENYYQLTPEQFMLGDYYNVF